MTAPFTHFCPVCRRDVCGHLLRQPRVDTFERLAPVALTPLDIGVARFAAEVIELLERQP